MKILVSGGNGQIGWELAQKNSIQDIVIALTHTQLDITDPAQINKALLDLTPDIFINAAAYTAVDKAEQEPAQAFAINRDGPAVLAQACASANVPLFHLSTDYVFSGAQQQPYREDDPTNPINIYGESKLAGEKAIRENWHKHCILRVSGIFSAHGHNFVKTILRLAQEKETLRIVADQIICPTPASDIVETILHICRELTSNPQAEWGTYHYCSNEPTDWYHFAEAILAVATDYQPLAVKQFIATTTANYPTPAKRPAYSVLDCSKLQSRFGIEPRTWRENLAPIIRQLTSEHISS